MRTFATSASTSADELVMLAIPYAVLFVVGLLLAVRSFSKHQVA